MEDKETRAREFKESSDGKRHLDHERFKAVVRMKEESVVQNKERKILKEKAEEDALREKIEEEVAEMR